MKFSKTRLDGVWKISPERHEDERGFFTRTFCEREFAAHGLATRFVQHSTSLSCAKGTVRGMHFQREPHGEIKLVSCRQGRIYDVAVDLRPTSPTYKQWEAHELSAENGVQLYIPLGCAHGFQTLTDNAEVAYLISAFYEAAASTGVRYNDPAIGIYWPFLPAALSPRDEGWPDLKT